MKINNNTSFPYPVLGIRNDIVPGLPDDAVALIESDSDTYNYSFRMTLKYNNALIESLVTEGKAIFTCEADCSKTSYNECFTSYSPIIEFTIPRRYVNGRVTVNAYIIAIETILDYDNPGKHEDFSGFTFNIEPGEILAVFPTVKFDTDLRSDILHVAGTFMEIRKDDNATETTHRLDSQKIGIVLPSSLYKIYQSKIGEQNIQIIHSSLAFNALICALYNLDDMRDRDLLWVRCILARFNEEEKFAAYREQIDKKDVPALAQALLDNPYQRLFNFIESSTPEQNQ